MDIATPREMMVVRKMPDMPKPDYRRRRFIIRSRSLQVQELERNL